jgi:hypothetical protein
MEFVSWIFFGPAKLVAEWQYVGVLLGATLIATQVWLSRLRGDLFKRHFFREAPVFAGILWLIFNLYELQMAAIFLRNQVAGTLRMDLIILVPILYVLTIAAIASIYKQRKITRKE